MAAVLETKTPADRNKMIAAIVLGVLALVALYIAFGPSLSGSSSTSVKVSTSPTPRPSATASDPAAQPVTMPSRTEQDFTYQTTAIDYRPGQAYAPDPGRNIFAFYEPPPPCPPSICPPPPPKTPTPVPATPAPTPPVQLAFVNPQMVYAGSRGFRLEVNGNNFTPDMHIYFNQVQMPTTFVNGQKLVTDIPPNMVANQGFGQVIVQNPDGKLYSNATNFTVQAPPTPSVTYIGMIARARHNNDTAYFTQQGQDKPFSARLNDVVQGRFRVIDITVGEVVFQDTELGFKHRVQLSRASAGGSSPSPGGFPSGYPSGFPQNFQPQINSPCVPGIPCNIPINPGQPARTPDPNKKDVDDDDDGPPE